MFSFGVCYLKQFFPRESKTELLWQSGKRQRPRKWPAARPLLARERRLISMPASPPREPPRLQHARSMPGSQPMTPRCPDPLAADSAQNRSTDSIQSYYT